MRTRDTTLSQTNSPPRSIQVGYGSYTQAYAALDRAQAIRTTGSPHQDTSDTRSLGLNNPTCRFPCNPPHHSVQTTQPLPPSSCPNDFASTSAPNTSAPIGSSATVPTTPRPVPPPPPSASSSDQIHQPGVSDESAYWVVLRGSRPGVYRGM